jgi:ubiquinone/menaquinone biosynthesis C-methylase UbiE
MDILEKNQQAFSGQAAGFASAGDTYADAEEMAWMLEELPLTRDARALDIACGTGEFSRALAPRVHSVIGLDATPAMMEQGEKFVAQVGIDNISFQQGVVQELPFEDSSFDVVASRYAFHHFADPRPVIAEMARVCRPGGHIIIVDIIVPEAATAVEYNYYEWLCDPSHTRALNSGELETYFPLFGLEVVSARRNPAGRPG